MESIRREGIRPRPMLIIPQPILQLQEFSDDLLESINNLQDGTSISREVKNEVNDSSKNSGLAPVKTEVVPAEKELDANQNSVELSAKDVNNNRSGPTRKRKRRSFLNLPRKKRRAAVARKPEKLDHVEQADATDRQPLSEALPEIAIKNFICLECDTKFHTVTALEDHIKEHSVSTVSQDAPEVTSVNKEETVQPAADTDKGLVAKSEDEVFPKLWVLTSEERKEIACGVCKKTFSRLSVLRAHKKRHFDPNFYRCDHCNKVFNSENTYKHHLAYSGLAPYKCTKCTKSFFMESKCQEHIERCEGKPVEKKYACEICGRAYLMKCSLRTHIKERHTEFKPVKNLCCEFCGKRFRHKKYLEAHVNSHSSERNFVCPICSKAYKSGDILRSHIRLTHKGPQRVACEICSKEVSRISLKNHLKRHRDKSEESKIYEEIIAHDENSPACKVCAKRFGNEKLLEMHRCEGMNGSFKCPGCSHEYPAADNLVDHTYSCPAKAKGSAGKTYNCLFCMRQYNAHTPWLYHVRHHTGFKPYQCPECEKSFRLKQGLKVHMRNHTGEKPFVCHLCPAAFKQKPFLLDHINTHTGEKPYQCDRCLHRFSVRSALSIHKRIHRREIQLQRLPPTASV